MEKSNIDRKTHIFWNRIALLSGTILFFDGAMRLMKGNCQVMPLIELGIGLSTVIVDYWFLKHV